MVADVSGKGVSSALLASLLQGALIISADQPAGLGRRMDAHRTASCWSAPGGEKYATIFYCLLHADGRLSYVNAGHCPPLVVKPGGELRLLEATGMPVGLMDGAAFAVAEERMEPGDKLVIYTDGVTEAQNAAGEFFGRKRLRETVAARPAADCAALHAAMQQAVAAFTEGTPQSDDITVLVLEFAGHPLT